VKLNCYTSQNKNYLQAAKTCVRSPSNVVSGSDEKTRLEINFRQPKKRECFNLVRHISPIGSQRGNTRKLQSADTMDPEAFFLVAKKNPTSSTRSTARRLLARVVVVSLLVASRRMKDYGVTHEKTFILSRIFDLSAAISA